MGRKPKGEEPGKPCNIRLQPKWIEKIEWVHGSVLKWVETCYEREFGKGAHSAIVITKDKSDFIVTNDDF